MIDYFSHKYFSPILLYHSSDINKFKKSQNSLKIHDVQFDELCSQLRSFARYFDFVSIDDWFKAKNKNGLISITFDDAYSNIFEHIIKELILLSIPSTVFIIGKSLDNKLHWREKVHYLIINGLIDEFQNYLSITNNQFDINFKKFYTSSKKISISSKLFEEKIDKFFDHNKIIPESSLINSVDQLVDDPLVFYGSHSYSHYLLSSLTYDEQLLDIKMGYDKIKQANINISKTFAVPFGGYKSINEDTKKVFKNLNINNVLLTNNLFESNNNTYSNKNINYANRYLPANNIRNKYKLWLTFFNSYFKFF